MTKLALDLSQRVSRIKPSPTFAVAARAEALIAEGKPIINLGVGEPDFDTPKHIKEAAIKAIEDGHTKYTALEGLKTLREAVIHKFSRENNLHYALDQILVSCGAKQSLYNFFATFLDEGDEVIIPAPYWVSYPDIVKLNDGVPVIIPADFEQSFKLTPEKLRRAITNRTRALIINSPSNPTGMAYTADELRALGAVLLEHPGIIVVSDDIYEHNLWNHLPFTNILNACPDLYNQAVIVNGVAKAYAMTGWRIGYAAGPSKIIAGMKKVQSQSTSSPATPSQYATIAALNGDQSAVTTMTQAYKERHDYIVSELQKIPGIKCHASDGTFYTFPEIKGLFNDQIKDDIAFADFLLTEANIAVIPGSAFGAPGYMRLSYATDMNSLKTAVERLQKAFTKMAA